MARLIVKVKYMKPGRARNLGKYARYIATREGVEKIDESTKFHEATTQQKELVSKLLKDYPESRNLLEYEDYCKQPTIGKASELITRIIEDNYEGALDRKSYADYIATRPRAERIGRHGLFTDDGTEVDLKKVSQELNSFPGTIWTAIISIRREDAERLGFDKGERWRDLVRSHTDEIARNFGIDQGDLRWYGAFHDESYHPHIHLIIYDKSNRAFLRPSGIGNLKSIFAHAIFRDEMLFIQNEKTERRDMLRLRGKEEIESILGRIKAEGTGNRNMELLLVNLAARLKDYKGRKVYGYLKKEDKVLVNSIIDEMEKIPSVKELYDLWYEKQEELSSFYRSNLPPRMALSANPEFKVLKNSVIKAASEIRFSHEQSQVDPLTVSASVLRLCNNVTRIFRSRFQDNPAHTAKVDRKLRRKIMEKEEAHGIKHE